MKYLLLLLFTCTFASAVDPFILVIKTDNPGTSASNSFTLPLAGGTTYDFTVAWGDGSSTVVTTSASPTRVYSASGTYTLAITENVVGGFPRINFGGSDGGDAQKVIALAQWGEVTWTSMNAAFLGCTNMTITATDEATAKTGSVTDFSQAWSQCRSLTSFPLLDTSAGTDFGSAWSECEGLTGFPLLNTSAGINFIAAWNGCAGLTSFPLLNTSAGTDFSVAWRNCPALGAFPMLDTSSGTEFQATWDGCAGLTSFPLLDLSSATNLMSAWGGCSGLTSFPVVDTSSVTDFSGAWYRCTSLTSFPLLDTSAGTNFFATWLGCTALASFPLLDTAAGTNFRETWYDCTSLTTFPTLDLRNMTDGNNCFANVTLSTDSYSDLLIGLAANNTNTGVTFSGGQSLFQTNAYDARNTVLVGNRGWTISDGGTHSPQISSATTIIALINSTFSYQIVASNEPTSYAATTLPAGLAINEVTGAITGTTPAIIGIHLITVTATNSGGSDSVTLTLYVNTDGWPLITSTTSAGGVVGKSFKYTITAMGNPTSFNATGLPPGLSITPSTGRISGKPTTAGVSTITLTASNANGTDPATLTLTIAATGGGDGGGDSHGCGLGSGLATGFLLMLTMLKLQHLAGRGRPR